MATVSRENIGTLHDRITVKLNKEDYWPSFEKSLKQYAKRANVPGFRKGMVPAGMVRKMYGQSLFGDEVLRSAGQRLEDYLKEEKLSIFAQPMIDGSAKPLSLDMNQPGEVDFTFEIGLKPDFQIPALENKETVTRYKVQVSDKMLDDEIERLRRRYGKLEDLTTSTSNEDLFTLSFRRADAGEEVKAVENTSRLDSLPSKLQELLQGKQTGETFELQPSHIAEGEELEKWLKSTFKTEPADPDATYKVDITRIARLVPAELNAELYLQAFPNNIITTEEEFREQLRKELNVEFERLTNERLQNETYEMLVHTTPIQLPVDFLKRWLREGQEKRKSEEEVEKEFPSFDHQLRWTLISDKLIQDNQIEVSAKDVKEDIKKRVLSYFGMESDEDVPWLETYMQKVEKDNKTMDETYRRLLYDRLFQWLAEKMNVKEKEVSEEEFFKLADPHAAHHHHH